MKARHLLIFLALCIVTDARYSLYHTDDRHVLRSTFDCLYAHLIDDVYESDQVNELAARNSHLTPYCRRPDTDEDLPKISTKYVTTAITFDELRNQNVTGVHLLNWFATMDVADRYENKNEHIHEVFYNCSPPWFGSKCQYKFGYLTPASFDDLIRKILGKSGGSPFNGTTGTCYPFIIGCHRGPSLFCLDWREVCDGKIDCLGGEDETSCEELEVNECTDGEYRCHYGGQCIPLAFVRDGLFSTDCLDGSDENERSTDATEPFGTYCAQTTTFQCEERTRHQPRLFSCGDGQYSYHVVLPILPTIGHGCKNKRDLQMTLVMVQASLDLISDVNCREAFYCSLRLEELFQDYVYDTFCESLATFCSEKQLVLPTEPILYGLFQFVYLTNRSADEFKTNFLPDSVCFDVRRCPALLNIAVNRTAKNKIVCVPTAQLLVVEDVRDWWSMKRIFNDVIQQCTTIGTELSCSHSSLFHCPRSFKCISHHRLVDGINDCYFSEDESADACQWNDTQRFKCKSNPNKCVSRITVGNGKWECSDGEDELTFTQQANARRPPFTHLCDGIVDIPNATDNPNENDETHCEYWPCDSLYSRCDEIWNCATGIDELNCPNSPCSFNEHECSGIPSGKLICLPVAGLFDKILDTCPENNLFLERQYYFGNGTSNDIAGYISWNKTKCITKNDICPSHSQSLPSNNTVCSVAFELSHVSMSKSIRLMATNKRLCLRKNILIKYSPRFLTASRLGYFPTTSNIPAVQPIARSHPGVIGITPPEVILNWYCNRGILVFYGVEEAKSCLCPPAYFGARCQWQSQRVSLTLQLLARSTAFSSIIYQVIFMLIDEQGLIAPDHEQIMYMPARDCGIKFNVYLLYPYRSKRLSTNYSVRIDVFDKKTLQHRTSWHLPIPFPFLPVNRIAARLTIPEAPEVEFCPLSCNNHGKCVRYTNTKSLYFCQCDRGYSGSSCNISHTCNCSHDSVCLAESLCVCSGSKFGPQCYIEHSICRPQNNSCKNKGVCVATDDRLGLRESTCLCPDGYAGETCEIVQTVLKITIDDGLLMDVSNVLVHFITAFKKLEHERTTKFKKIAFDQSTIILYVLQSFNIVILELPNKNYYLTVLREIFTPSEQIQAHVLPDHRCLSIHELLNTTSVQFHPLRRMKYYPLLCRQNSQVLCFYDELFMCVCDLDRYSNCFEFNHTITHNCQDLNVCENNARCFQNNQTCPTQQICVCQDCFYGTRCQFSTKTYSLSLDTILGYYIKPHVAFDRQPVIVRISVAMATIMLVLGFINGFLSIFTFHLKKSREVGSSYYILTSASISMCTMIVLNVKLWQLISSQMAHIHNRLFLEINCILTDMILKICLTSAEWLNACVAIDRMSAVLKGISFSRAVSKRQAKWIIPSIVLFTTITHIHDPIHRRLIDDFDIDDERTWCMVRYSPSLDIFDSCITILHVLVPFIINLISALVIIITTARTRFIAQSSQSFMEHLQRQLRQHKDLLVASCVLVLLGLPRLIITFASGCVKSSQRPSLFLTIYFVPFVSSLLTFMIFVLPSEKYKKDFLNTIQHMKRRLYSL